MLTPTGVAEDLRALAEHGGLAASTGAMLEVAAALVDARGELGDAVWRLHDRWIGRAVELRRHADAVGPASSAAALRRERAVDYQRRASELGAALRAMDIPRPDGDDEPAVERRRLDVYVRARNVVRAGLRTQEITEGVHVDWWQDADGNEHVAGVEVLEARGVEVDGQARWEALHHASPPDESLTWVEWRPMCSRDRIDCPCMEPDITGPCEEFKACGSPRCGQCGWPLYRHTERARALAARGSAGAAGLPVEPPARTPRGFALWADFTDLYGKPFTVQQSSLATEDAVWVGSGGERGHLSVEQARIVHAAIGAFLADTGEAPADRAHTYLSTPCRHDQHTRCSADTALDADGHPFTRRPAQCKTCAAPCVCPCHRQTAP